MTTAMYTIPATPTTPNASAAFATARHGTLTIAEMSNAAQKCTTVGVLVLTASDTALKGVRFPLPRNRVTPEEEPEWVEDAGRGPAGALLARARRQLTEYFEGTRTCFDLPLDAAGSAFERRVWDLLRTIPYVATPR